MTIDDVPISIHEAAKRLRAVKKCGYSLESFERVYDAFHEKAFVMADDDRFMVADWFLETFPEVGR